MSVRALSRVAAAMTRIGFVPTESLTAGRVRRTAGGATLLAAVAILLVRLWINAPVDEPPVVASTYDAVALAALVVPSLAAVAIGATSARSLVRVGMVFTGVFGLLVAVSPSATVPAAGAVTGGGLMAVAALLPREPTRESIKRWVVAGALAGGLVVSLAGSLGVAPAVTRPLGTRVGLLGVALSPVLVDADWRAWSAGVVGGGAVAAAGMVVPFVLGAVTLVGGAILGASLPLVALAAIGGVTLVAAGLVYREFDVSLAGALVATAGVPASLPRAVTLVVGLVVLLAYLEEQ